MKLRTMRPRNVKEAIRYLTDLTTKATDPKISSYLRPIIFAEFRRAEIELAILIKTGGDEVHFLA